MRQIDTEFNKGNKIEVNLIGTVEEMPLEYDTPLLRSPSIPKIALKINSILNIELKESQLDIGVTPWTIFELPHKHQPYGFTLVHHNLYEEDMENSVRWMLDYIEDKNGQVIFTDFDEKLNLLSAKFPLEGCMAGEVSSENVQGYCQKIYNSYRH